MKLQAEYILIRWMQIPISLIFLFFTLFSCNSNREEKNEYRVLEKQMDSLRIKYNIPAIAYGVVRNDSVIVQRVIGYRNIDTGEKTEINDLFHIGSNTKAFTAFMAGKLVDDGLISWDTKFFDLFPEMLVESNPVYHNITLQQLLSHRARLIPFKGDSEVYPIVAYEAKIDKNIPLPEKRYHFIRQVLTYDPIPVYDHHDDRYSNAGYIAATLMLEKTSNRTWEEMISEISDALNLDIHIGWPDSYNAQQPWGNINPAYWDIDMEESLIPIPEVLRQYHYFNQLILLCTPSGHLSIPVNGFLEFLRLHIKGINGEANYLKAETYRHILSSYSDYSLGWAVRLYGRTCYHHRGSAGTFSSIAMIIPEDNLGIVIMVNTYRGDGLDEIAQLLINKFGGSIQ